MADTYLVNTGQIGRKTVYAKRGEVVTCETFSDLPDDQFEDLIAGGAIVSYTPPEEAQPEDVESTSTSTSEEGSGDAGGGDSSEESGVNATSGAIRLAEEKGVDLAEITGSGENGRITKPDVEAHIQALEGGGDSSEE